MDSSTRARSGRVVVFAPNWLGDAVMALPAIGALRAHWPDAVIDVVARAPVAPLFTLVSGVGSRTLGQSAVETLKAGHYDTAILLPNSFNTARIARAAGIRERWGYATDFRTVLLTRAVARPSRLHQSEFYSHLARALGIPVDSAPPSLGIDAVRRAGGLELLRAAGWDAASPIVALAPGAAFGGAKRWPASSFADLGDRLHEDGVRTVVIGSAADRGAADDVRARMRTPSFDLVGRTDLPALASVLVHVRGLVTNDSGAMHLAAALGVNIVGLFGPTRERETYPLGTGHRVVLTHDVWCRPCMLRECPLTHACLRGILPDRVFGEVRAL